MEYYSAIKNIKLLIHTVTEESQTLAHQNKPSTSLCITPLTRNSRKGKTNLEE